MGFYEKIVGRKLKSIEIKLVDLFSKDENYQFYKNEDGNLAVKREV